jgi:hypothetical protein
LIFALCRGSTGNAKIKSEELKKWAEEELG